MSQSINERLVKLSGRIPFAEEMNLGDDMTVTIKAVRVRGQACKIQFTGVGAHTQHMWLTCTWVLATDDGSCHSIYYVNAQTKQILCFLNVIYLIWMLSWIAKRSSNVIQIV